MQTIMSIVEVSPETDLVQLIGNYLPLQASRKVLKGICPFHPDTAHSLMVYASRNQFKCFGCGLEGGPEEFLAAIQKINVGLQLREAI